METKNKESYNVYEKLTIIQNELKVKKSKYNEFGKFNYRTTDHIFNALKPLLKLYNVNILLSDEIVVLGTGERERFYVKATATFTDCNSTHTISVCAFAKEPIKKDRMDESQTTGSASTYARKYALNGLLALDDVQDLDSMDNTDKKQEKKKPTVIPTFKI